MTIEITEEDRQLILMGLAYLAVERPGWDYCLTELALKMDMPESAKRRQVEALTHPDAIPVAKGKPVLFERFKKLRAASTPVSPGAEPQPLQESPRPDTPA